MPKMLPLYSTYAKAASASVEAHGEYALKVKWGYKALRPDTYFSALNRILISEIRTRRLGGAGCFSEKELDFLVRRLSSFTEECYISKAPLMSERDESDLDSYLAAGGCQATDCPTSDCFPEMKGITSFRD